MPLYVPAILERVYTMMPASTLDILLVLGALYAFLVAAFLPGYIAGRIRERRAKLETTAPIALVDDPFIFPAENRTASSENSGDGAFNLDEIKPASN
jgi:hypothetical protein